MNIWYGWGASEAHPYAVDPVWGFPVLSAHWRYLQSFNIYHDWTPHPKPFWAKWPKWVWGPWVSKHPQGDSDRNLIQCFPNLICIWVTQASCKMQILILWSWLGPEMSFFNQLPSAVDGLDGWCALGVAGFKAAMSSMTVNDTLVLKTSLKINHSYFLSCAPFHLCLCGNNEVCNLWPSHS